MKLKIGIMSYGLSPYIPTWRHNFTICRPKFHEGIHVFKVSLNKSWKTISVDAHETLSGLADAILREFDLDIDHLYYFLYKDWRGISTRIVHDFVSEGTEYADERIIASLSLEIGQPVTFLYDFGDERKFNLQLEERYPKDLKLNNPHS